MAVLLSNGRNNLKNAFHHILDSFTADIDSARGIFIKPNIVFPVGPRSGEITSPSFVRTLIFVLRERYRNIDIILGEGAAAGCDPFVNFRVSGFAELARALNVPLIDLDQAERVKVDWKFGKLELPRVVLERSYINLPILKHSSACVISGALKNQKGLLLPVVKKQFHRHGLHEQIAELGNAVRPVLTIMDASRFFGRNALISGDNCGEIDATACQLLGIDEPEHIQMARSVHVYAIGFSVTGDKLTMQHRPIRPGSKPDKRLAGLRLWSNPQACTGCRYLFQDIQHNFFKKQGLKTGIKLLPYSIRGAEIVMGSNPQWRRGNKTVICIGDCTRQMAKEAGYIHIPGCPPTLRDIYDNLP